MRALLLAAPNPRSLPGPVFTSTHNLMRAIITEKFAVVLSGNGSPLSLSCDANQRVCLRSASCGSGRDVTSECSPYLGLLTTVAYIQLEAGTGNLYLRSVQVTFLQENLEE